MQPLCSFCNINNKTRSVARSGFVWGGGFWESVVLFESFLDPLTPPPTRQGPENIVFTMNSELTNVCLTQDRKLSRGKSCCEKVGCHNRGDFVVFLERYSLFHHLISKIVLTMTVGAVNRVGAVGGQLAPP